MMTKKKSNKLKKTVVEDLNQKHTAKIVNKKVPSAWQLAKTAAELLWQNKALLTGITLIYGLLSVLLVQGLSATTDVATLKGQLNQAFTGNFSGIASNFSVFMVLLGSVGSNSSGPAGSVYQFFLGVIVSLAIIWALRQMYGGVKIRIRDAYYQGMTPLIPFILVIIVIGLQLLPMLIGSTIYSIVIANGIAVNLIEKVLWFVVFAGLSFVSLYWISASILALYIVTLPDMTPIKALRSAKDLAKNQRWVILRKLLFLPLVLLIVAAIIILPIIAIVAPLAQWVFILLSMFSLTVIHTYIYVLYRELIGE